MDFRIRIVTTGDQLSTRTMWSVLNDLNRDFEKAIYRALSAEFPRANRTTLAKYVKGKVDFIFEDIHRGSWEVIVIGGVGRILGKAAYDLVMDFVKGSDSWKRIKEHLSRPSRRVADELQVELQEDKKLGPLVIERRSITVEKLDNGFARINVEMYLRRGTTREMLVTSEQQVEALLIELEKRV